MRYVLDASAALCWVLPRPNSGKALQLRADFQNAVHELVAPSVFSGEVARWPFYKSLGSCRSDGGDRGGVDREIGRNAVDGSQTTLDRIVAGGVFG